MKRDGGKITKHLLNEHHDLSLGKELAPILGAPEQGWIELESSLKLAIMKIIQIARAFHLLTCVPWQEATPMEAPNKARKPSVTSEGRKQD